MKTTRARLLLVAVLASGLVVPAASAQAQTAPSPAPGAAPAAAPSPMPTQGTGATPEPNASASPRPAPEPVRTVTEADSGTSISLTVGQVLEVQLDGSWTGPGTPGSNSALYLVRYRQNTDATTARLQALRPTSETERLTATSDPACLHSQPTCSIPTRTWSLDVTVTGTDDGSGSYPCYSNPSPSPAAGTVVLTERDARSTVRVEQNRAVLLTLNGCGDQSRVPTAGGPLFRQYASYEANGGNTSFFRALSLGKTTISSTTDPACFHVPLDRACPGRPNALFTVDVEVVAATCPATVRVPDSLTATGSAPVVVSGTPGRAVRLFAYSRPSTNYRLVREATISSDGTVTFTVRPPTNTRLYASQDDCNGPSVVLNVRTALTLTAERLGTRLYRFAGDSLPARPGGLIVSLYRVSGDGLEVLTAQARADAATGEWSLERRFTGAGRFGFLVRTGQDLTNAPGESNVRSTLVF